MEQITNDDRFAEIKQLISNKGEMTVPEGLEMAAKLIGYLIKIAIEQEERIKQLETTIKIEK